MLHPIMLLLISLTIGSQSLLYYPYTRASKEDAWFLESYQKHKGQAVTFVSHIQKGVEVAEKDDAALLLFSGGETRKDAGPRSEAQSYWIVAESKGWFGGNLPPLLDLDFFFPERRYFQILDVLLESLINQLDVVEM